LTADHVLVVAPLPQRTGSITRHFAVTARARRFEARNESAKVGAHCVPPCLRIQTVRPIIRIQTVRPIIRIQTVRPRFQPPTKPHNPMKVVGHDHEGVNPGVPANLVCSQPFIHHNLTSGREADPTPHNPAKERLSLPHTGGYEVDAVSIVVVF
jgi:hypothetical protein